MEDTAEMNERDFLIRNRYNKNLLTATLVQPNSAPAFHILRFVYFTLHVGLCCLLM